MGDEKRVLFEQAKDKNIQALARMLSEVERLGSESFTHWPELLKASSPALRIGITGPPGAGKSTLVGRLISEFRQKKLRIAVIAVDPSSPFSRGAILADRIRYSEHSLDSEVYIRSVGSRGSLGGLSAAVYLMLRVFDHCQFDVVLIETVGVGQSEFEVLHVSDVVSVVLVPESGDSVQAMKAGLLEIADVFVVNKSDRPGAQAMTKELQMLGQQSEKDLEVFQTVATQGKGLFDLAEKLYKRRASTELLAERENFVRLQAEAVALLRQKHETEWMNSILSIKTLQDFKKTMSL